MKPEWLTKTDPEHHPVRFLAGIWEQQTRTRLTSKQMGQLRDLRKFLGEFTSDVIRWVSNPVNWWRYSQQVRAEAKLYRVPLDPEIGFLLFHRNRALKIIRRELRHSTAPADASFCAKLDQLRYDQLKPLTLLYAANKPEWLVKIGAAKTVTQMQQVFLGILDENSSLSV